MTEGGTHIQLHVCVHVCAHVYYMLLLTLKKIDRAKWKTSVNGKQLPKPGGGGEREACPCASSLLCLFQAHYPGQQASPWVLVKRILDFSLSAPAPLFLSLYLSPSVLLHSFLSPPLPSLSLFVSFFLSLFLSFSLSLSFFLSSLSLSLTLSVSPSASVLPSRY